MSRLKLDKTKIVGMAQILIIITFFIIGFTFKSDNNAVSSTMLGMLTKVQSTNNLQNFAWLFTHNLTLMFVVFWISYFSFGSIGTLWCINNSFMIGALAKIYLTIFDNAWLSILFMALELVAGIIVMTSSTYFRLEKRKLKKAFEKKSNEYIEQKKKQDKKILYVFALIATLLLIAAILETLVLSSL